MKPPDLNSRTTRIVVWLIQRPGGWFWYLLWVVLLTICDRLWQRLVTPYIIPLIVWPIVAFKVIVRFFTMGD